MEMGFVHKMQHYIIVWKKLQQLKTTIIFPWLGDRSAFYFMTFKVVVKRHNKGVYWYPLLLNSFSKSVAELQRLHTWYHLQKHLHISTNTKTIFQSNHINFSLRDNQKYYLTQSVNTDVGAVLWAQCPILNFTCQGKEEIIAFSKAVQLTYILFWKQRK